jgi:hypothetical protein
LPPVFGRLRRCGRLIIARPEPGAGLFGAPALPSPPCPSTPCSLSPHLLRPPRASEAAGAAADELARTLGCNRVSIGFLPPGDSSAGRLQLAAVSHTVEMAPRQALSRALAAAMAEAA